MIQPQYEFFPIFYLSFYQLADMMMIDESNRMDGMIVMKYDESLVGFETVKVGHELGEPRSRNCPGQRESSHQIREEVFPHLIIINHQSIHHHPTPYKHQASPKLAFALLSIINITLLMSQLDIPAQTRQKNRKKLIQQNIKLRTELTQLQKEIDALQEQSNSMPVEQPQFGEIRAQIEVQERQIRQLKEVVEAGRQSNAKENMYYIKKEEDQLAWLKQELQTLAKQKQVVGQSHQDKVRKLAANEPLLRHKEEITRNWNQTKRQNREISLKMVELQRQTRRLHALKEMAKNCSDVSPVTNEELQLATLQAEISRMNTQMKTKELKWKPNGQVLDNQYFTNRGTIQIMQRKIQELEKEEGIWRTRAAALRDGPEVLTDRERLSKVATAPKVEHIIKPQLPPVPKQPVKPQSIEKIMQKEIKDNIKNDKFVEMVRVASTPSSTVKKSIQLQPIEVDTKQKEKPKVDVVKQTRVSSPVSTFKMKKSESLHSSVKKQKSENQFSIQSSVIKESGFDNKNGNNWMGRRGKIKSKQSVNTSNLAELIQQKADEVKKINKQEKEEKEMERSVSSPKKLREKKDSIERDESYLHLKSSKEKVKQKTTKQGNFSPLEPKYEYKKQVSFADKSLKEPKSPKGSQMIKPTEPVVVEKKAQTSTKKSSKPKKQAQLVEKINIIAKINNFPPEKKTPKKIETPVVSVIPKQAKESKEPVQQKETKRQQSAEMKPLSPQNKERPVFEILMSDSSKPIITVSNQGGPSLEDQNDGVPKIIKRKRKVEGQLVTTGTST